MQEKGVNVLDLKKQNRRKILTILRTQGALSRKDISNILNLTPAAVTIITNEMLEEGVLIEIGQEISSDKKVGRKKVLVDINYNLKYIIGISIDGENISIGLSNLKGDILASEDLIFPKDYIKSDILKFLTDICVNLLWKYNISKQEILGMGVGVLGSVDVLNGISKNSYGILPENLNIKAILEGYLGIPVCVDNNVRALAMAEIDFYSNQVAKDNMMFVKYGPGIGATIVINNEIYVGSNNNAGELGHTIVNHNGELCKCGKKGCLETIASPSAIINKAKEFYSEKKVPYLYNITKGNPDNITLLKIIESAQNNDESISLILDEAAFYIAMALSTSITLLDPKQVVFYCEPYIYNLFLEKLKLHFIHLISNKDVLNIISVSSMEYSHKFLGGISLALRKFFYNEGGKL